MANEESINAQVSESPASPTISVQEIGEFHTPTPFITINNPLSPSFLKFSHLFSSYVPPTPSSPPFFA